jgi:hypothetical protein
MTKTIGVWFCLLLMLVPVGMLVPDGGGEQAVNDSRGRGPMIYDVYDLQNMSRDLNASYVLANDINASVTKEWNGGAGFEPVGNSSGSYPIPMPPFFVYPNTFKGSLFGNGHTVTGLHINRPSQSYTGLFGLADAGCNITDVNLVGVNITGYSPVGGLVGRMMGKAANCTVNGTVNGYGTVGVLAGSLESGASLSSSSSSGKISGFSSLGGLVGSSSGTISRCFSTADVSGTGSAGGLTAFNSGSITNSYSCGAATGGYSGGAGAAGFVGEDNRGTMINCYSTGRVTGSGNIGGFLGKSYNIGTCSDCFWDNLTSGMNASAAGTGKNTTDMMRQATFTNWNFTSIWKILENRSYPFLLDFYTFPAIVGTDETAVKEDATLSAHFNASISRIPAMNDFSWSFSTNATGWLSLNATTGNLSGTPDNSHVGRYWVNITLTDSVGYRCIRNFTLTVENVAPVLLNVPPTNGVSVLQDGNYSFDVDSDDEGLGNTAYGFISAPDWLGIDASTGAISGMPGNGDVGRHTIVLFVNDGNGGLVDYSFDISVIDVNDPPVITTQDVATATQGIPYRVVYQASDIDPTKETFSWSLGTNASWLEMVAATGLLFGTPGNADVGAWWVNITVDDGRGGQDSHNFTVTVANVNDPPAILTQPVAAATEGVLYLLNFSAQDPDVGDAISWSLTTDADWLTINSSSGALSGTPVEKDVGSVWVSVTARDQAGANATVGFNLKVLNVNDPPVWVAVPPDQNITEGASLFLDVLAADPDAGTTMRYSVSSLPASGIAMNPVSGAIRWMDASAGNYTVTVGATDGSLAINATFNVTVNRIPPPMPPPANNPPLINPVSNASVKAGQALAMKLTGIDNDSYDAKNLTFRIVSGPAGMIVSADGNIAWTPTKEEIGSHSVIVSLSDGKNSTSAGFSVTVNKPAPAGTGTGGSSDNSLGLIAGMLVVGLAIGAVAVFVALRKKA